MYIYIYIYIERERERERECVCVLAHVFIRTSQLKRRLDNACMVVGGEGWGPRGQKKRVMFTCITKSQL